MCPTPTSASSRVTVWNHHRRHTKCKKFTVPVCNVINNNNITDTMLYIMSVSATKTFPGRFQTRNLLSLLYWSHLLGIETENSFLLPTSAKKLFNWRTIKNSLCICATQTRYQYTTLCMLYTLILFCY